MKGGVTLGRQQAKESINQDIFDAVKSRLAVALDVMRTAKIVAEAAHSAALNPPFCDYMHTLVLTQRDDVLHAKWIHVSLATFVTARSFGRSARLQT